jgi:hypothetical protein
MTLIDLAIQLGTEVPNLAKFSSFGNTWSDATRVSPTEEKQIREGFQRSKQK